MTGTIETMSKRDVRRDVASSQSRLASFAGDETTYIAIVRSDDEGLRELVDETMPALAPPEDLFYQWLSVREEYEDDSAVNDVQAHNMAVERVEYHDRFTDYLDTDVDAQAALDELTARVQSGEHIVLVCYCGEGRQCHRTTVADRVRRRCNGGEN